MPEPAAKILVADDDQSLVRTLTWILKENGYEVVTAPGGEGLMGKLEEERPNLLLLDIMMPKVDGLQLLARMKADDRLGRSRADDLVDASRGGDRQGAGPGRGGLHLQAVPGAGAPGAREGAHPLGAGAGPGARRGPEPRRDRRHPARGHGLPQTRRDLSHPGAARRARAADLEVLDGAGQARRPAGRGRGGVRKPHAPQSPNRARALP